MPYNVVLVEANRETVRQLKEPDDECVHTRVVSRIRAAVKVRGIIIQLTDESIRLVYWCKVDTAGFINFGTLFKKN